VGMTATMATMATITIMLIVWARRFDSRNSELVRICKYHE
jgi:hypothetical protein